MDGEMREDGLSPPATFHFRATLFDGVAVAFQEMAAPDGGAQEGEYRHGDRPVLPPRRTPEPDSMRSVTLKKGLFTNDSRFRDWYAGIGMNTLPPGTVTIALLDEAGARRMTWTLERARPLRIAVTDLAAGGPEVAVESLDIAYETLVVTP
jgi:phage tail-like protein